MQNFLDPIFAQSHTILGKHEISHQTEWILTGVSTILIIVISVWAWKKYNNYQSNSYQKKLALQKCLENKWYVDELYDRVIVKPL
ncbi:MAG: hypothetical protein WKF59_07015 [Chitinophagaceae bacterium]